MAAYEILLLNTAIPQIQAAQSGDTYVCPRDIAFSAALTLSAGTANGVPYLNGSKVLTTGSALVFNGTQLGINGSPSQALDVTADATAIAAFRSIGSSGNDKRLLITSGGDNIRLDSANQSGGAASMAFSIGSSEQMRLTSTGLGIGTSSPTRKLQVYDTTSGYQLRLGFSDSYYYDIGRSSADGYFDFYGNQSGANGYRFGGVNGTRLTIDSSGNLGLGVTPPAWDFGGNLILPGAGTYVSTANINLNIAANTRYSGGGEKYVATNPATKYLQGSGTHVWFNAPSGTADGTAATALTSAQNGNSYTIKEAGTTDFTLIGAANNNVGTVFTKSGGTGAGTGTVSQNISFTQAMTLDASGNLGVGETNPALTLHVKSAAAAVGYFETSSTGTGPYVIWRNGTTSIGDVGSGKGISGVGNATDFMISSRSTYPLLLSTGSTERARITSGGDFQTSSGNSVMVGGTAARATTAGTNRVDIFDGTAPVGTLANGVSFYSASGEANVMDAAGNATLLSPHDAETNEWIFRSKHTPTGKVLKIDVERLLKFVNDHFGLDAVHEFVEK